MRSAANVLRDKADEVDESLRRAISLRTDLLSETDDNEARIANLTAAAASYRTAADRLDAS